MKKLLIIALLVAGCSTTPDSQPANGFLQNNYGQRVSWNAKLPVHVYLDSSVPQSYYNAIQTAMDIWSQNIGRTVFVIDGTINSNSPSQDGINVIYWMNSWPIDSSSELQEANTTVYWVDNQIIETDIRVNLVNYSFSTNPIGNQIDVQSVITHELGHALGLIHIYDQPSVMNPTLAFDYIRRQLYSIDQLDIKCEY